jgi:hypothetical protein
MMGKKKGIPLECDIFSSPSTKTCDEILTLKEGPS